MSNRFLISVAAIALIAGAGAANAQGTGMNRESGGAAMQHSAPSGTAATPANRDSAQPSGASSDTIGRRGRGAGWRAMLHRSSAGLAVHSGTLRVAGAGSGDQRNRGNRNQEAV